MPKCNLHLGFVDRDAARYACEHWHYSKCTPVGKMLNIGVWEDDVFIGVVIFGNGASFKVGKVFGLSQSEICELNRVALTQHKTPVTRIISIAIRMMNNNSPNIKMIVSYADSNQGHLGKIYQAGNWYYLGSVYPTHYLIGGKKVHDKTCNEMYIGYDKSKMQKTGGHPKYKYAYPLTPEMKKYCEEHKKEYPKKCVESIDSDASCVQQEEGGAHPTSTLHNQESK